MPKHALTDLNTLFILRFVLDDPTDMVDLNQDITDLSSFPERLYGSYLSEWKSYVQKKIREKGQQIDDLDFVNIIDEMNEDESLNYQRLIKIIHRAQVIVQSDKVKVIKSPLKTYIESLLKL